MFCCEFCHSVRPPNNEPCWSCTLNPTAARAGRAQLDRTYAEVRKLTAGKKKEPIVPAPRDKNLIFSEIEAASASSPGSTKEQRVAAFLGTAAGAKKHAEYLAAPLAERPAPTPAPAPINLTEAERVFSENPQRPGAAWDLIEAKARALAAKDALTFAAAVERTLKADPDLYVAYRRGEDARV